MIQIRKPQSITFLLIVSSFGVFIIIPVTVIVVLVSTNDNPGTYVIILSGIICITENSFVIAGQAHFSALFIKVKRAGMILI